MRKIKPRSFEEVAHVAEARIKTVAVPEVEEGVVTRVVVSTISLGSSCLVGVMVVMGS